MNAGVNVGPNPFTVQGTSTTTTIGTTTISTIASTTASSSSSSASSQTPSAQPSAGNYTSPEVSTGDAAQLKGHLMSAILALVASAILGFTL
jgi:hypothetical protein